MTFFALGTIAVLLGSEFLLQQVFGLGRPLLYRADPHTGYRVAPNQKLRRFGNRIQINQFSMRNAPISPTRSAETLRILMLGDSLVNGMVWTDQTQTLTALVQSNLEQKVAADPEAIVPHEIEVLNVAAGSWGPRNELAYLQQFGTFQSQILILVLNTDDFFGAPPRPEVVGHNPNYPDRNPPGAWAEVLQQLWRRLPLPAAWRSSWGLQPAPLPPLPEEKDVIGINLKAIDAIYTLTQAEGMQFFVVLSPLRRELEQEGGSRDYEKTLRQRFQDWADQHQVAVLDLLPLFNAHPRPLTLFSDHIHLSSVGNQEVAAAIVQRLQTQGFLEF
ncbi:MAG: SGNH/GDSL hydrolase family protein [Prochlorotrichaceae cyanobacterium]|jgi:hypothetical protein